MFLENSHGSWLAWHGIKSQKNQAIMYTLVCAQCMALILNDHTHWYSSAHTDILFKCHKMFRHVSRITRCLDIFEKQCFQSALLRLPSVIMKYVLFSSAITYPRRFTCQMLRLEYRVNEHGIGPIPDYQYWCVMESWSGFLHNTKPGYSVIWPK